MNIQNEWAQLSSAYQPFLLRTWQAVPVIGGKTLHEGQVYEVHCPYEKNNIVGEVRYATAEQVTQAMDALAAYWPSWNATPVDNRASILEKLADLLEKNRPELMRRYRRSARGGGFLPVLRTASPFEIRPRRTARPNRRAQ